MKNTMQYHFIPIRMATRKKKEREKGGREKEREKRKGERRKEITRVSNDMEKLEPCALFGIVKWDGK